MADLLKVSRANPNSIGGPNVGPIQGGNVKVQQTAPAPVIQNTAPVARPTYSPQMPSPVNQVLPDFDPSIRLEFDPTTASIQFYAPDYVLNSPEFKDLWEPELNSLIGRAINDNDVKNIMNNDFIKSMQKHADEALRPRYEAVSDYQSRYEKATEDDALLFFRNLAAAERSDKDKNTQLVVGVLDDGTDDVQSVADIVKNFSAKSDRDKADYLAMLNSQVENPESERTRAIAMSLAAVLEKKKLTQASTGTKINEGLMSWLSGQGPMGGAGWLVDQATRLNFSNPGQSMSETYKEANKDSNMQYLEGVEGARGVGSVAAIGTGIVSDLVLTQGRSLPLALSKGISTIPKVGGVVNRVEDGITALSQIKGGNTIANVLRESPKDVAFGISHSVAINEPENTGQSIMTDLALNAGFLGAASAIGRVIKNIDTASNGALYKASALTAAKGFKAGKVITDLPGVGNVMKKLSTKILDENAPIRRQFRENIANAKTGDEAVQAIREYKAANNIIRQFAQKGTTEARAFRFGSESYQQLFETNRALRGGSIERLSPTGKVDANRRFQAASKYVEATTMLSRIEAGQYGKVNKNTIKRLETIRDETFTEEAEQYRQQLVAFTDEVTQLGVNNGILDGDIIRYMQDPDNKDFANDYIHLQRDLDIRENPVAKSGNRSVRNATPIKRLVGVSEEDIIDPFITAQERLEATTRLIAQNRLALLTADAVESGVISGRVITDPADVKMRNELKFEAEVEKEIITDSLKSSLNNISEDLNRLVDDVEDFAGEGQIFVERRVESAVDEMLDSVGDNPKLASQMVSVMDELGGGEGIEEAAAAGILYRQRKAVKEKLSEDLVNSSLGAEERKMVLDLFESNIISRFENNMIDRQGTLRDGQIAVNARSKEIRRLNAEIASTVDNRKQNVVPFYEGGQKGFVELDDPALADYFNSRRSIAEDGIVARLMTFSSRVFRAGTTGLDPLFVLFVNPVRDMPQAAIASGAHVLAPENIHRVIMETQGVSAAQADEILAGIERARVVNFRGTSLVDVARGDTATAKRGILSEPVNSRVYRELQRQNNLNTKKGTVANLANPRQALRNVESVMGRVEYATRSHIFNTRFTAALKRGETVEDAVTDATFYASEATANFYNVGAKVRQMVRTVPYLNAAIQGNASFMRLWALDPIGVTLRMAGGVAMPAMVLAAHNLADEDRANAYFQIPEYTRKTNFIVMLDGENWIELPMSFEVAKIFNPIRDYIEVAQGVDNESFQKILVKSLLGASPVDLSALTEQDLEGNVDFGKASLQILSGFAPQLVRPMFEMASGSNFYTGQPLNPDDGDLYARGDVDPGEAITPGDRTYASRDSQVLRTVADALAWIPGMSQGKLQNVVSSYTGTVGQYVLNTLDKVVGAPESRQGGRSIGEAFGRRFSGNLTTDGQKNRDYFAGMERIDERKEMLKEQLAVIDKNATYADDKEKLANDRQRLIDDFGSYVADFANNYSDRYGRAGGLDAYQMDRLVDTLNFSDSSGAFAEDTYQQGMMDDVQQEARTDANRRAIELGLPGSSNRDLFGRMFNNNGALNVDYSNTSMYMDDIRSRIYGAPKQIAYEFSEIVKADRDAGIESLYDIKSRYDDRISDLYDSLDSIASTDKKRKDEVFSKISEVEKEYMRAFDERIKPLVEKYGVEVLEKSRVFEELSSYIMVPNEMTPFFSKKKTPYLKEDAKAYLLDRYGVGKLNQSNRLDDFDAAAIMKQVNSDLEAGRIESADFKLRGLEKDINSGRIFVNEDTMAEIEDMVYNLSSYKKRR